jgi:SAM-dependent methyltransferase
MTDDLETPAQAPKLKGPDVARAKATLRRIRERRVREYAAAIETGFVRLCPLCGYEGEFAPVGLPPRLDGLCPSCRSRERHRLFKLWLDREGRVGPQHKLLHFAPEPILSPVLQGLAGTYVTADLMMKGVDLALNIEAMALADASFDVMVAHQILEHVDHKKALAECYRCLTPGGFLLATTPLIEAWAETYVNPEATSRKERVLYFGQADHSRYFGRDLKDDMRAAGFALTEYVSIEPDVSTYGLIRGETLFVLEKPQAAGAGIPPLANNAVIRPTGAATTKTKTGKV